MMIKRNLIIVVFFLVENVLLAAIIIQKITIFPAPFIIAIIIIGLWVVYRVLKKDSANIRDKVSLETLQKLILNEACYAIIAADPKGVISPAAEKLLGYRAEDLIGKQNPSIFHDPQEVVERAAEFSKELNEPLVLGFDVIIAKSKRGIKNTHEWTYAARHGRLKAEARSPR
jgi:PAS domain S-box-containing protein